MDLKYDLMKHPGAMETSLAGGPQYIHHTKPALEGQPLFVLQNTIRKEDAFEET